MGMKDAYIKKLKGQLDEWSADIEKLKAKAGKAEGEAELKYHKQMEALREKQDKAREKLDELEQASEDAWEDLKAGVESAWASLKEAVTSAKSQFK